MKRKRTILMTLLILLAASGAWCIHSYPRPGTVDRLKYPPGSRAVADGYRGSGAQAGSADPDRLRLDLYENHEPAFTGYQRNPFQPIFVDRETLLARQAAAAAARARKAAPPPPPVRPVAVPSATQRELAGFRFHGLLEKDGRKTVFLSRGDDIVLVKEGDTVAGRYLAASLTDQVLVLRVTDTGEELVMPLVEGRSRLTARR
jgi:hypothetical protein